MTNLFCFHQYTLLGFVFMALVSVRYVCGRNCELALIDFQTMKVTLGVPLNLHNSTGPIESIPALAGVLPSERALDKMCR